MTETEEIPEGMKRCRAKNPACENQFEDYPLGILPKTPEFFHRGGYYFLTDGTRRQRLKDVCKSCANKHGISEELPEGMKRCKGECEEILPATTECFHASGGISKQGLPYVVSVCRSCANKHGLPIKEEIPEGKKKCPKCGKILSATTKFFGRDKNSNDGLKTYCKPCKNKQSRERYRERHPKKPAALLAAKGMKTCTKCEKILPATLEYFTSSGKVSKQGHPYLRSVCKGCFNKHGMPEKLPEGKKRCTECEKILPATLEYFKAQPQSSRPRGVKRLFKDDGRPYLTSKCKSCINKLQREDYDPEEKKKYNDQYREDNNEELLEKAAARRARPGAKEQAVEYQRGHRKTQKKEQTEALNALLRSQNVPEPDWGEDEYADEEKFEEKIEELIVQRYGVGIVRRKRCEKLFAEYGITRYPDTYIPELNLIVEAKLLSGMWKSPTKRKQFIPQVLDYQKVCDTVIVSLDGRPDWWETEEEITDVTWLNAEELLDFIDELVFDKRYESAGKEIQQKIDKLVHESRPKWEAAGCPESERIEFDKFLHGELVRMMDEGDAESK